MRDSRGIVRAWPAVVSAAALVLQAVFAAPAFAGAWTLPKGKGLIIATALASEADKGFAESRRRGGVPAFRKAEIQALAEYGISDRFTVRGRTEFQDVKLEGGDPERRTGLGFSEIGGRYRVFERGGFVGSVEANLRIAEAHEIVDPADAGLLEGEYEARLLGGYGFSVKGVPVFANLEAAYRARGGERPDEGRVDATLGVRPLPKLLALAQLFSVVSLGGETAERPAYDYHKVQLSGVYDLTPRFSLQLGGFASIAGRNALDERGLLTALWVRF